MNVPSHIEPYTHRWKQCSCFWACPTHINIYQSFMPRFISCRFSDHFIGLSTMGKDMTFTRIKQVLDLVYNEKNQDKITARHESTCELMVHPGYKSIIGCGGCGEGPDVFACSAEREHELCILKGSDLKDYLRTNNIQLHSFKSLV